MPGAQRKSPWSDSGAYILKSAKMAKNMDKSVKNYQFPLVLRDFCSIALASLNAAANKTKKSLIANKGLKLKTGAECNCTEFECAMVSSLRVNPNDTPNILESPNSIRNHHLYL